MNQSILAFRNAASLGDIAPLEMLIQLDPNNAGAWYFLGALHLRQCHVREAARCFGAAYHRNCDLETAVLFTFACLKSRDGRQTDIVEQLLATWQEIRERGAPRTPIDQLAAQSLMETAAPAPRISSLGKLIWSVVGADQRQQLETLIGTEAGALLRL